MPEAIYYETLTELRLAVRDSRPDAEELERLVIALDPPPTAPDVREMSDAEFEATIQNYAHDVRQWQMRNNDLRAIKDNKS